MKPRLNFHKMLWGVSNTDEILSEINLHSDLWDKNTLRTNYVGSAHEGSSDMWLRFNDIASPSAAYLREECFSGKEMIDYPARELIRSIQPIVGKLMFLVEGERLGRIIITRLRPGQEITPHADEGSTALYYDRFHVVLKGSGVFTAGEEFVKMKTGDVWWFNNQAIHSVKDIDSERIHLIIDIKLSIHSPFFGFKRHSYRINYD
jgi:quercetin dioxygenase-like cupin family protein